MLSWFATVLIGLAAADPGPVVVVPLRSEVSEAQFYLLRRALKEAERDGASAFIIDMQTFGGSVDAALKNMAALQKTRVPTLTYINDRAISAGALIALATQRIYMSPTAIVGASAPVKSGGEELSKTMTDKTVSMLSATARAAAQKNGHNADVAEAFVNKAKELKMGDVVLDGAETLLTLSSQEAARLFEGKPLFAVGVVDSLEALLQQAGLTGAVRRIEPTGFEQFALWITALAPLFLMGGILGAYIEMKTPGFGVAGFVSVVCFTIFFTGHYIAGLAGWEVAVIFAVGLVLVISELFLHPGTVLPGVAGALMMVGALIWAMIDRYPGDAWWPTGDMLARPLLNLGMAFIAGLFGIYLLAKILPKTSLYHYLVLDAASPIGIPASTAAIIPRIAIGTTGLAKTTLRPSGKADFDGHMHDVTTDGDYIEPGARVRVVAIEGARVVVEGAGG